jgi:ParB family chromosome partitioning protein
MAKKRGSSPLGNAVGAVEAQKSASKSNLESLAQQFSNELSKNGEDVQQYLQDKFGFESVGKNMLWHLDSGSTANFTELTLSYDQVRDDTFVTFDINGRDQALLTNESLEDLASLNFQQFYPAVGRDVQGKIDILDGSRRRAWFLLQKGRVQFFRVLVTKDVLSTSDAKQLAKQLQTAKEHNLREIGKQCFAIQKANTGIKQADIAKMVGLSQAGVSKVMKAAGIDESLIKLFPIVNDLSHVDYSLLDKVMKVCEDKNTLSKFVEIIAKNFVNIQAEYEPEEYKDAIILEIKKELKVSERKKSKDCEVVVLVEFESKGMFARKRIKGRNFSYEFGRLSQSIQDEIDEAISRILKK